MSIASMNMADLIGATLAFVLTLLTLSYLIGDNPLFRFAIHLFVGVASGIAVVIAFYNILWPQLIQPLIFGNELERFFLLIPLILSGLLLTKISHHLGGWGRLAVAFLIGVGAATAIGGAIKGTLFPQAMASINLLGTTPVGNSGSANLIHLAEGAFIIFGTLSVLAYFQFGVRKPVDEAPQRGPALEVTAWIGQAFIAVAFGALFAGVYLAALSALVDRLGFVVDFIFALMSQG